MVTTGNHKVAKSSGIETENIKVFVLFANQLAGLEETRRRWRAEGGTDLVRLLQEFSDRQASDDRDKVYGLLSLAKEDQKYIKPNYELDVFETYRATVLALIGKGRSLACWAGDQKRKFNRGLPSWIPDWSTAIDNGDKHRLNLFDNYNTNSGWTLRFIYSEREYWATVESQMELLIKSPAVRSERLPASLRLYVIEYTEALRARAESVLYFRTDGNKLKQSIMDYVAWNHPKGFNVDFAMRCLRWCKDEEIFPRSGKSLLQQWIQELDCRQMHVGQEDSPTEGPFLQTRINELLRTLNDAIRDQGLDLNDDWRFKAGYTIHDIEDIALVSEHAVTFPFLQIDITNLKRPALSWCAEKTIRLDKLLGGDKLTDVFRERKSGAPLKGLFTNARCSHLYAVSLRLHRLSWFGPCRIRAPGVQGLLVPA